MAARKNRPVLFEMVRRQQSERRKAAPPAPPPRAPAPPPPVLEAPEPPTPRVVQPQDEYEVETGVAVDAPGVAPTSGGTLARLRRLDLGPFTAMNRVTQIVLSGCLLLLLLVAFQLGRYSASATPVQQDFTGFGELTDRPASDSGKDAAQPRVRLDLGRAPEVAVPKSAAESPPASPLPAAPEQPSASSAASEVESFAQRKGLRYLIVQYFPTSRYEPARQVQEFLRAQGVDCALMRRGGSYVLIARQGFDVSNRDARVASAETRRSEELRKRVVDLGARSRPSGYLLKDCLFETAQ